MVGLADSLLSTGRTVCRVLPRTSQESVPKRILLVRLERLGDLLMTMGAIRAVRGLAREAEIHLVVGSWNEPIARLVGGIDQIQILDVPWMVRDGAGSGLAALFRTVRYWRSRSYDLAIVFEGDIRTNLLAALSGAVRRVGFGMAGGGPVLTDVVEHDGGAHTAVNALRLVERAFDQPIGSLGAWFQPPWPTLTLSGEAMGQAERFLADTRPPLIGIHASGGRAIKQWDPSRFAAVAERLALAHGATIVMTGTTADRSIVDDVKREIDPGVPVIDVAGQTDVLTLAAVLAHLSVFVTADTGPMHLAAAVGAPVVAIFGPSDSERYAPLCTRRRIVRVELPCSPCNCIRRPPARCVGHLPDCLADIDAARVTAAVEELLLDTGRGEPR